MSSGRPLISILLLCYNQQDYVGEAVDGALDQTYSPLEILIFDDCSPDKTAEVIRSRLAARQTPHEVRFIANPKNLSATETLKMAFALAKASFFVMSCGDDIMLPRMVEEMSNVWLREKVSLVTANAMYIDEHSNSLNRTFRDPNSPADDTFETLARDGGNACCFGAAIGFEREVYTTFGWVEPPLEGYDIMVPFYAYLLNGARFISEPLLKYRVHAGNSSLSLLAERASGMDRLQLDQRIWLNHIAHAVLMDEAMDRLRSEAPERYRAIAERIRPLLTIQITEMARRLVNVRRKMTE